MILKSLSKDKKVGRERIRLRFALWPITLTILEGVTIKIWLNFYRVKQEYQYFSGSMEDGPTYCWVIISRIYQGQEYKYRGWLYDNDN